MLPRYVVCGLWCVGGSDSLWDLQVLCLGELRGFLPLVHGGHFFGSRSVAAASGSGVNAAEG